MLVIVLIGVERVFQIVNQVLLEAEVWHALLDVGIAFSLGDRLYHIVDLLFARELFEYLNSLGWNLRRFRLRRRRNLLLGDV